MAKNLTFVIGGNNFEAAPVKVDRKKLYGWTETKAFDDDGNECYAVNIDGGGEFIIPKGGTSLGVLDTQGCWVDKASLKTVLVETGEAAVLVPSSYDEPIQLGAEISAEEFLDHEITAFYQLTGAPDGFAEALNGKIFAFVYSFRANYEGSPAFILAQEGAVYMFTGNKANFEFLSLQQAGVLDIEGEEEEDEDEEIDFSFT